MKTYVRLLVPTILLAGYASAATISLTGVSPVSPGRTATDQASTSSGVKGISSSGVFSTVANSGIDVFTNSAGATAVTPKETSGIYSVKIANVTVGAFSNLNLTFDLNIAAAAGSNGIVLIRNVGGWMIDTGNDGASEAAAFGADETIAFSLSNIVLTGGDPLGYNIVFNGFTSAVNVGGTGVFTSGQTGIMTGTGGNGNVNDLAFSFDIVSVPEPSCITLGAMGAALLLRRRRR